MEGCFITTATLHHLGGDSESVLNVFRGFRDGWLRNQPEGAELIAEYYRVAPSLVDSIDRDPRRHELYRRLWTDYLAPCQADIERGDFDVALHRYRAMMVLLQGCA